jgi:hypothetical protein
MPNTVLDLECLKGETTTISLELSDNGVPYDFTDYDFYFTIVEDYGMTPVIDVDTTQAGQTVIAVSPLAGLIDITLSYLQSRFDFLTAYYSILAKSPTSTATFLLIGKWKMILTAKQLTS